MSTIEADIVTPCNRVCTLHPALRLCMGCGRSLEEIAGWIGFADEERTSIMTQLPARLAAMTGRNITGANIIPTMA
jgi:uncharacterized protein